jgi:flagellar motor switch protein FliG
MVNDLPISAVPFDELEHSGLARQVSILLTNHLARATESNGNEAAGNEALQEILNLLNNLSRSVFYSVLKLIIMWC